MNDRGMLFKKRYYKYNHKYNDMCDTPYALFSSHHNKSTMCWEGLIVNFSGDMFHNVQEFSYDNRYIDPD